MLNSFAFFDFTTLSKQCAETVHKLRISFAADMLSKIYIVAMFTSICFMHLQVDKIPHHFCKLNHSIIWSLTSINTHLYTLYTGLTNKIAIYINHLLILRGV